MDLGTSTQATISYEESKVLRALLGDLAQEASERRFEVAPNPCVGAAVLSNGVEIGRGFHEYWGGAHAEVNALAAAEASGVARELWDTIVVTLEPCSSTGKTAPCSEALLVAGIKRVVVGSLDPDPRHRGKSLESLHKVGVEVVLLKGASPLHSTAPHFERWMQPDRLRRPRPWTISKWAQTRTGQLSPPDHVGEGRWISCQASLDQVQLLRSSVDAVITGIGTVLADDPRLSVRPPGDLSKPPLRVIIDSHLRTRPEMRILQACGPDEAAGEVHIFALPAVDFVRQRELKAAGAIVHAVSPGDDGCPSLREICTVLWGLGVRRQLVEAGPVLTKSWFQSELVDQLKVYTGDVNGGEGPNLVNLLALDKLLDPRHSEVGVDSLLQAFPKY